MNLNHPNVVFFESSPDEWRWIIRSKDGAALARCEGHFPSMGEAQVGYEEFLKVMRDPKTNRIEDAA